MNLGVVGEKVWDYLLYTQRWAPGACADWLSLNETASCYEVPTSYWTIHGLWPGNTTGDEPFYCNDTPLNLTELESITPELMQQWPTTRNYSGDFYGDCVFFWQHEWDKHGTCAMALQSFATVFDYFDVSLQWNKKYDVYKALESHGVVPSTTRGYNFAEISEALQEAFGKVPDVICTTDNLIHEVRICFDKQSSLIDCTKIQTECDKTRDILYR